jgi:hypothetical protein
MDLFSLSVVDCSVTSGSAADPRYFYACLSSSIGSRFASEIVQLIIVTSVVFFTALCYAIYRRVCVRRLEYRLRGMPAETAMHASCSAGRPSPVPAWLVAHGALLLAAAGGESAPASRVELSLQSPEYVSAARELAFAARPARAPGQSRKPWSLSELDPALQAKFLQLLPKAFQAGSDRQPSPAS